jgi:hypothetical protein
MTDEFLKVFDPEIHLELVKNEIEDMVGQNIIKGI